MFIFAELCKGSTADSDSVCLGSNPSSAAKNPVHVSGRDFTFYFLPLHSYLKIKFTRDFWEVISNR